MRQRGGIREELQQLIAARAAPPPPDAVSVRELAQLTHVSSSKISATMAVLRIRGKVVRDRGRGGNIRNVMLRGEDAKRVVVEVLKSTQWWETE